jgi:hypothetical protein
MMKCLGFFFIAVILGGCMAGGSDKFYIELADQARLVSENFVHPERELDSRLEALVSPHVIIVSSPNVDEELIVERGCGPSNKGSDCDGAFFTTISFEPGYPRRIGGLDMNPQNKRMAVSEALRLAADIKEWFIKAGFEPNEDRKDSKLDLTSAEIDPDSNEFDSKIYGEVRRALDEVAEARERGESESLRSNKVDLFYFERGKLIGAVGIRPLILRGEIDRLDEDYPVIFDLSIAEEFD